MMKIDSSYKPLPPIFLFFTHIWALATLYWLFNTYRYCRFQPNKLQWMLSALPLVKATQLLLSYLFWNSFLSVKVCSLWMSFGVYATGVLFQTSAYVSFLLISYGYCITYHRVALNERRSMAAIGCVFYLALIGYRACVPYFSMLVLLCYSIMFYVIFHYVSHNLEVLRDQLSFVEDEDVQSMSDAIYMKYIMFKKFQGAMHIMAVLEIAVFMNIDNSTNTYWIRLLMRECSQLFIFLYIGWIFRLQQFVPRFNVMPALKSKVENAIPPIYSIEMDPATFKDFTTHEWHIGVPTPHCNGSSKESSVLVIIQHPHAKILP